MLDDAFLFHEALAPMYLGMNQNVVLIVLGIAVLAYLTTFRQFIMLGTNYRVLLLALGFLATSAFIDVVLTSSLSRLLGHWRSLLEDGPKWLGISIWCSYYVHTAHLLVVRTYGLPDKTN